MYEKVKLQDPIVWANIYESLGDAIRSQAIYQCIEVTMREAILNLSQAYEYYYKALDYYGQYRVESGILHNNVVRVLQSFANTRARLHGDAVAVEDFFDAVKIREIQNRKNRFTTIIPQQVDLSERAFVNADSRYVGPLTILFTKAVDLYELHGDSNLSALQTAEQAARLLDAAYAHSGGSHSEMVPILEILTRLYLQHHRYDDAMRSLGRLEQIGERLFPENNLEKARFMRSLGFIVALDPKEKEQLVGLKIKASSFFDKAISIYEEIMEEDKKRYLQEFIVTVTQAVGENNVSAGRRFEEVSAIMGDDGVDKINRALNFYRLAEDENVYERNFDVVNLLALRAVAYELKKEYMNSIKDLMMAFEIAVEIEDLDLRAEMAFMLAHYCYEDKRYDDAEIFARHALELIETIECPRESLLKARTRANNILGFIRELRPEQRALGQAASILNGACTGVFSLNKIKH